MFIFIWKQQVQPLSLNICRAIDSEQVMRMKDEKVFKNLLKYEKTWNFKLTSWYGLARFASLARLYRTFCIRVQQVNLHSELKLVM